MCFSILLLVSFSGSDEHRGKLLGKVMLWASFSAATCLCFCFFTPVCLFLLRINFSFSHSDTTNAFSWLNTVYGLLGLIDVEGSPSSCCYFMSQNVKEAKISVTWFFWPFTTRKGLARTSPGNFDANNLRKAAPVGFTLTFIAIASYQDVDAFEVGTGEHRHGIGRHEFTVNGWSRWEAENARVRIPLLHRDGLCVDRSHAIQHSSRWFLEENSTSENDF